MSQFSSSSIPTNVFEKRTNAEGNPNPKYVDLLEEDRAIAGQKFVCVSFVSPDKILKQKDIFFFEQFLNKWDFSKSMDKFVQFISFVSFKYKLSFDDLSADFKEFVKEEHEALKMSRLEDDYKTFIDQNEEGLENAFNSQHQFQTSTRGLKIRGVYPSIEEAELRCKMLREIDPSHDVFVGPVGLWMPWDPEAYKTGRVEYLEDELNQLMLEKNKNESFAKTAFDKRLKESKQKAIEDNIKLAEKTGSTLTQNIDEEGNLIGVGNVNTQERELLGGQSDPSKEDIQRVLFEGDNIITDKKKNA